MLERGIDFRIFRNNQTIKVILNKVDNQLLGETMRYIFIDLHVNAAFLRRLDMLLFKKNAFTKHRFILDYLLSQNEKVVNLITLDGSRLPTKPLRRITRKFMFRKLEANFVFKKNHLQGIENITSPEEIREDDVIIYYATGDQSQFTIDSNKIKGTKVVDLIHFYGDAQRAKCFEGSDIQYFSYDVDIRKYSPLFRKNYGKFNWDYIPKNFTYQKRFCVKKDFSERKNMAVAMGTVTHCTAKDFIETYGSSCYQPRRKMVMDHANEYPNEIYSHISEFLEGAHKKLNPNDFILKQWYTKVYNLLFAGRQKKYFSFDMVDEYNDYKMFICPEDINGSYGIGTTEGMACGCAMIGCRYGAFEDMGMKDREHYIAYDGTMEDLIAKIRYYQMPEHQEELAQIAKNGYEFARKYFSEEYVAKNYCEQLKALTSL